LLEQIAAKTHGGIGHHALLIIDDLGMRKLGLTAAEELLEIVMRRCGRTNTPVTGPSSLHGRISTDH
jgi:hypothetical protein